MKQNKECLEELDDVDPNFNGEETFASHNNRNDFDSFLSDK